MIKDLEIKTFTVFNLVFAINAIFFFFLVIYLFLLITAVIAQIFNPASELVIPIAIPSRKAELEI